MIATDAAITIRPPAARSRTAAAIPTIQAAGRRS